VKVKIHRISLKTFIRGVAGLETGVHHTLRVEIPKLHVRLPIDPAASGTSNDSFILTVTTKGRKIEIVQTVKDDQVPGDSYVDLVFSVPFAATSDDASYALAVDPGPGGTRYLVFDKLRNADLFAS
jgi:hypothetical protein